MANYVTTGSMALVAGKATLSVISASTVRPAIYDILFSSSSTPNDYSADFQLQRFTADGTGTGVTAKPLDFADPVAIATSKHTYTVDPTLTANELMIRIAHNQRATARWVAAPGSEIRIPATAGAGAAMQCNAVSTQFTEVTSIYFNE